MKNDEWRVAGLVSCRSAQGDRKGTPLSNPPLATHHSLLLYYFPVGSTFSTISLAELHQE